LEPAPAAPNRTGFADQDVGKSGVGMVPGPGEQTMDMAGERVFPAGRQSSLRFLSAIFNQAKRPQFGNPDTVLGFALPEPGVQDTGSSTSGQISAAQEGPRPRLIEFVAQYLF
jgi:hypothetical protein